MDTGIDSTPECPINLECLPVARDAVWGIEALLGMLEREHEIAPKTETFDDHIFPQTVLRLQDLVLVVCLVLTEREASREYCEKLVFGRALTRERTDETSAEAA